MKHTRSLCRAVAAVLALSALGLAAPPQSTPNRTTIAGRVLSDDGRPIPSATVIALQPGASFVGMQRTTTDAEGRFELASLDQRPYRIVAQAPAYVLADEAQRRAYHRPGSVVTLTLAKGGAITGTVLDGNGRPLVNLPVRAIPKNTPSAPPGFSFGAPMEGATDDRGVYRIYGLAAGEYLVRAGGKSQIAPFLEGYPEEQEVPTFHPSSTRDTATPVSVLAGGEATGIDVRYRGLKGHAISGAIGGLSGGDDNLAAVVTLTRVATGSVEEAAIVMRGGSVQGFAFYGLSDGEYVLVAETQGLPSDAGAASRPLPVTVRGADVTGLSLGLLPLASVSGTLVVEPVPDREPLTRCARPIEPSEVAIRAVAVDARPASLSDLFDMGHQDGVPGASGAFTMRRLRPGRYRLVPDPPDEGWFVRSMTLNRPSPKGKPVAPASAAKAATIDAARVGAAVAAGQRLEGLVVTMAPGAARVDGRVVGPDGRAPAGDVEVFLVPAEEDAGDAVVRFGVAAADRSGAFAIRHVAPGRYRLVARPAAVVPVGAPRAPAFLDDAGRRALRTEALGSGQPLDLAECARVREVVVRTK